MPASGRRRTERSQVFLMSKFQTRRREGILSRLFAGADRFTFHPDSSETFRRRNLPPSVSDALSRDFGVVGADLDDAIGRYAKETGGAPPRRTTATR